MTNAEQVAEWLEGMPHDGIYRETTDLRKILLDGFKPERASWDGLTPERISTAVADWLSTKRVRMQPELEPEMLADVGAKMREWLSQHEERTKTPALLSVDEFQGAVHAFHCTLRGLDMFAEQKAAAAKRQGGNFGGNFNLKG